MQVLEYGTGGEWKAKLDRPDTSINILVLLARKSIRCELFYFNKRKTQSGTWPEGGGMLSYPCLPLTSRKLHMELPNCLAREGRRRVSL